MYSLRVAWFVDFYSNPTNRHFKGGKIAILSVQSICFCEAKAAFELVNNPWLSAILTGMVFGIWNAAFKGSVPRKTTKSFEGPQSVKSNLTWHDQLCIWKGMQLSREAQGAKVTYLSSELWVDSQSVPFTKRSLNNETGDPWGVQTFTLHLGVANSVESPSVWICEFLHNKIMDLKTHLSLAC